MLLQHMTVSVFQVVFPLSSKHWLQDGLEIICGGFAQVNLHSLPARSFGFYWKYNALQWRHHSTNGPGLGGDGRERAAGDPLHVFGAHSRCWDWILEEGFASQQTDRLTAVAVPRRSRVRTTREMTVINSWKTLVHVRFRFVCRFCIEAAQEVIIHTFKISCIWSNGLLLYSSLSGGECVYCRSFCIVQDPNVRTCCFARRFLMLSIHSIFLYPGSKQLEKNWTFFCKSDKLWTV